MRTLVTCACYFGPASLYKAMMGADKIIVDLGENYVKQTYRNRTRIMGANGVEDLIVPTRRSPGIKIKMREVHLSHTQPWPRKHTQAIKSAYGQSPWAIHYLYAVEDLLSGGVHSLSLLDVRSMRLMLDLLTSGKEIEVRKSYVDVEKIKGEVLDLRDLLSTKKPMPDSIGTIPEYPQVFQEKHGFVGDLSILDLLFNTGPEARKLLTQ